MFADILRKYYNDMSKGLLFAFETGYKAIPGIYAVDIDDWQDFEDKVDSLVDNKSDVPFRLVGLDTADVLYDMAQAQVIREWNVKNPSKRTSDIGGVGAKGTSDSGYGVGYTKIKEKIRLVLSKLKKAGFGIMVLTHSKDKTVEQHDGQKFDQLAMSLPSTAREIFVNDADFMLFITVEKEKTKNGIETVRKIFFRNDGYVEAGGRFTNVPESIVYDGDVSKVIEVFENAVKGSFIDANVDINDLAKKQLVEKEEKAQKFVNETKKSKVSNTPDELKVAIKSMTDGMSKSDMKKLADKFKEEFGSANYNLLTDVDQLQTALEFAKELAGK